MAFRLTDLFSWDALRLAIDSGHVAERDHPLLPLRILNYTDRCQYERGLWNDVTLQCRGLIYDTDSLEVVGRPFRKFFNYGQPDAPSLNRSDPVTVTDKVDGSLGIVYPTGGGYFAVATRGSFESEQAIHATDLWDARFANYPIPDGWTVLVEIVYPENRIVVDYGDTDDLILLGAVEIETGREVGPEVSFLKDWEGPRATVFDYPTLADALAATPRPNAEGLVITAAFGRRVKLKQEDYIALHRVVTGLNERTVWEHTSAGKPISELLDILPDEFHGWTQAVANRMTADVNRMRAQVMADYQRIVLAMPTPYTRRDFAALAIQTEHPSLLFAQLDGKGYWDQLWKLVYPAGRIVPRNVPIDA